MIKAWIRMQYFNMSIMSALRNQPKSFDYYIDLSILFKIINLTLANPIIFNDHNQITAKKFTQESGSIIT